MKVTYALVFSFLCAFFSATNAFREQWRDPFYNPHRVVEMDQTSCKNPVKEDVSKDVSPKKEFYNTGEAVDVTSKDASSSFIFFKYRLICKDGVWEENDRVETLPGCKPPNVVAYNSFTEHEPMKERYNEGEAIRLKLKGALKFEGKCENGIWELEIPEESSIF